MAYSVVVIAGDGIGPEVVQAACRVVDAAGVDVEWVPAWLGQQAVERYGDPFPAATRDLIRTHRVVLKGPVATPIGRQGFRSAVVALRRAFDLYANVRPIRSLPGVPARYADIDLVIVRENTEGFYSGPEQMVSPGVVESVRTVTERAATRIARYAFTYATRHGRQRVTAVHKANIFKLGDGLFLECCRRVARDFPEIAYEEIIVDNACLQMVLNPYRFDVLVMENLYGDLMSDLAAGLVGGLGVVPSANIGDDVALFEAVHGTAPDIAGRNRANPTAMILSAVMMLRYLGETAAADRIERALLRVLADCRAVTPDLGGTATTTEMTDAVIRALQHETGAISDCEWQISK